MICKICHSQRCYNGCPSRLRCGCGAIWYGRNTEHYEFCTGAMKMGSCKYCVPIHEGGGVYHTPDCDLMIILFINEPISLSILGEYNYKPDHETQIRHNYMMMCLTEKTFDLRVQMYLKLCNFSKISPHDELLDDLMRLQDVKLADKFDYFAHTSDFEEEYMSDAEDSF